MCLQKDEDQLVSIHVLLWGAKGFIHSAPILIIVLSSGLSSDPFPCNAIGNKSSKMYKMQQNLSCIRKKELNIFLMFVKWTRHVLAEVLENALILMVQNRFSSVFSQHGQAEKRNLNPNTGRVFPQAFSFGRYRLNYQVPTGIQFNEAHMYVCSCRKQGHISDM